MEQTIVAKMKCLSAVKNEVGGEAVELTAVYSDDPKNPNHSWSQATPSGSVKLYISNPSAQGFFQEGQEYYVNFRTAASVESEQETSEATAGVTPAHSAEVDAVNA